MDTTLSCLVKKAYHVLQRRSRKWRYSCKCVPCRMHERKGGRKRGRRRSREGSSRKSDISAARLADSDSRVVFGHTYFSADPIGIASLLRPPVPGITGAQLNVSSASVKRMLIARQTVLNDLPMYSFFFIFIYFFLCLVHRQQNNHFAERGIRNPRALGAKCGRRLDENRVPLLSLSLSLLLK